MFYVILHVLPNSFMSLFIIPSQSISGQILPNLCQKHLEKTPIDMQIVRIFSFLFPLSSFCIFVPFIFLCCHFAITYLKLTLKPTFKKTYLKLTQNARTFE